MDKKMTEKEIEMMKEVFRDQLLQSKLDKEFYKRIEKPFKNLFKVLCELDPEIAVHAPEIAILDGLPKGVMV